MKKDSNFLDRPFRIVKAPAGRWQVLWGKASGRGFVTREKAIRFAQKNWPSWWDERSR